jgi:hypothetical protein
MVRLDDRMPEEHVGEDLLIDWLKERGWTKIKSILNEIEAEKDDKKILVQVKSSVYPIDPGFLTEEEMLDIREHATRSGAMPHLARIWMNNDLTLKDDNVMWRRL